jgi:phospholipase C
MSDNSFDTTFGPSTPGALNLISGQTGGVILTGNGNPVAPGPVPVDEVTGTTVTGDPQPYGDVCSTRDQARLHGTNIGNLLNAKGVSWGFFQGGFDLTKVNPNGTTGCTRSHPASGGVGTKSDYIPHHEPFQYYASTSNLMHARPTVPPSQYGTSADTVTNHQYDSDDFFAALGAGNLPAVSFLKAPGYQDGHAGYSDPLLEQGFVVNAINTIMTSKFWKNTAIIIAYDDSDGWYDHQMGPIVNSSATMSDALTSPGHCGNGTPLNGVNGRCGYGPRLPLLVISPFAKPNFVDHTTTDQSSILRFIEDNWGTGRIGGGSFDALAGSLTNMFDFGEESEEPGERRLILDPITGAP